MQDMAALTSLCAALAAPDQPTATWRALDETLQQRIGHRLLTVLRIDPAEQWSERIYSSQPGAYAAQGRKALRDAPQMGLVVAARRPLLVDGVAAVRTAFPDHERILALGCSCVLNVPVLWRGRVVANVNILDAEGSYGEAAMAVAQVASHLCLPALLSSMKEI